MTDWIYHNVGVQKKKPWKLSSRLDANFESNARSAVLYHVLNFILIIWSLSENNFL